jgi:hypothetical protein
VGPNGRWYPRICGMAVVWTLNASSAGARRAPSIEGKIWDGEGTSVSATVSRTVGAGRGSQQTRMVVLRIISKRHSLQRYSWVRNAPYAVKDRGNPLKSQQMRPPSERTSGISRNIFPSRYSQVGLRTWIVLVPSFPLTAWRRREAGRWSQRSARGVARAASQIDLQLLELGDALIDAPLPYLVQRSPDLRR